MKIAYIYHVIGTLTMDHIRMSLESLSLQHPFHWDRFILWNASDLPSDEILPLVDRRFFDRVEVVDGRNSLKSCSADWLLQMQVIDGADRYLCHKADFYLPRWICRAFEAIDKEGDFLVLFNKFDMKSRAFEEDIRRYAHLPWGEALAQDDCGSYQRHLGYMAIPFEQPVRGVDGTMHGYTDGVRAAYRPSREELQARWGVAWSFREIEENHPDWFHRDEAFFAVHMWHDTPDRTDPTKNISADERF